VDCGETAGGQYDNEEGKGEAKISGRRFGYHDGGYYHVVDNVLAVAGAVEGSFGAAVVRLGLSIPTRGFTSKTCCRN